MTDIAPPWHSDLYGILLHPSEPRLLLLPGPSGYGLPHARVAEGVWEAKVEPVARVMQEQLGVPLVVLRYAYHRENEETREVEALYVLDARQPLAGPPLAGRWVDRETLASLSLAHPEQRVVLEAVLDEVKQGEVPTQRAPWARRGWFEEAAAWIEAQVVSLGWAMRGPVEQVKNWGISCVLRAPTTGGAVYFKVSSTGPLFGHEPLVTQELATLFPESVPRPLTINAERRWMLLPDLGSPLRGEATLEMREEMFRLFAQLQCRAATQVEVLLEMGCLDRRLAHLAAQIDPLLEDAPMMALLTVEEVGQMRALAPRLKELCGQAAAYNVPQTLVHGDLHLGNVAQQAGRYLIFDWTDSCITHPFIDLIDLLSEKEEAIQERLLGSYLAFWTEYEPMERLWELWEVTKPLCALHQMVSYQYITNSLEPAAKQDCASGLSYWARHLLRVMGPNNISAG